MKDRTTTGGEGSKANLCRIQQSFHIFLVAHEFSYFLTPSCMKVRGHRASLIVGTQPHAPQTGGRVTGLCSDQSPTGRSDTLHLCFPLIRKKDFLKRLLFYRNYSGHTMWHSFQMHSTVARQFCTSCCVHDGVITTYHHTTLLWYYH